MNDLDFELAIRPIEGNDYEVAVVRSPAGEARATMHFPFDGLALKTRLQALEIALLRSGGTRRQLDTEDGQTVRDFGRDLFDALISGDVRGRFDASLAEADHQGKPLRVRLRFETPGLAALPWEFLYDKRQPDYLVLSSDTPLVRYIEVPEVIKPLTVRGPLRILGVVASPTGMTPLDVERERSRMMDATAKLRERGLVEVQWLDPTTPRELQAALRREKWHIFHFAGHGGFDPNRDEGVIALTDEQGGPVLLPATQLGRLLGDHKPLRLALLNACEGARGGTHDLFSSTAATLVRRGTPAVVAMQYEITDDAAKEFGRSFYEAIADGSPVDIAVAEARKSVSIQMSSTLEWGTPVLFMRTDDGVLFRIRRERTPPVAPGVTDGAAAPEVAVQPAVAATSAEPTALPSPPSVAATTVVAPAAGLARTSPADVRRLRPAYAIAGGLGVLAVGALAWSGLFGGGGVSASPSPPSAASSTSSSAGPPASAVVVTNGPVDIALALGTDGSAISNGVINGVDLALRDVGFVAGNWQVPKPKVIAFDHGDLATAKTNMTTLAAQDSVVAVVGPQMSSIAKGQIPISNAAGLLQCSPSTATDGLTKPPDGPTLRASHPEQINFVRTVTTNAADAPAAAQFILRNLRRSRVFIVDNGVATAIERTRLFKAYFEANGGTVVGALSAKREADLQLAVTDARAANPDVLYFSGSSTSQGLMTRFFLLTRSDFGALPYLASGEIKTDNTFSRDAGAEASTNVYTFVAAAQDFLGFTDFRKNYANAFGTDPGPYSSTAYECAAVILDAIKRAGDATGTLDLRAKVRAAAVDPTVTYHTVTGEFHFDENGDTSQLIVSVYRFDPRTRTWGVDGFIDAAE